MAIPIFKSLFFLPLLFVSSYANFLFGPDAYIFFNKKKLLGPHELFGNPFGDPNDYKNRNIPDDTPFLNIFGPVPGNPPKAGGNGGGRKGGRGGGGGGVIGGSSWGGAWELVSQNSGVSAMHAILLPKVGKVLMYDATIWKISKIKLPNGECRVLNQTTGEKDCWCHSVLFDINTSQLTPLELHTDTWCSSGGLTIDGNLVGTGGFQGGANTVRYLERCPNCNWREFPSALADRRWYSTQAALPDGRFIVVGGRDAFSYEYIPLEGQSNKKPYFFNFLRQTNDKDENNLYPFVHLSTDGNVFIFANNRSVLLNPNSNQIVREFPVLPGGKRNYPASGMSVLLPLKVHAETGKDDVITAEVLICGGSAHVDAYSKADKGVFYTALQDCGRIRITDKNPVWKTELMPTPRIMGDMMILPTGDVLMLNGAIRGSSGWGFAREPNYNPTLYSPKAVRGQRFRQLAASGIARMYHSSSVLLQDGKILVGGSNTNNGYVYNAMFPTELRIEKFSPPYLDPAMANNRPQIVTGAFQEQIGYGNKFQVQITSNVNVDQKDVMVTMYAPAFTTHGVSMNQRLINLGLNQVVNGGNGVYNIEAFAPPRGSVAPPGYYMLYVVYQGVPSVASWVQIK